jgi:hypothetical protein
MTKSTTCCHAQMTKFADSITVLLLQKSRHGTCLLLAPYWNTRTQYRGNSVPLKFCGTKLVGSSVAIWAVPFRVRLTGGDHRVDPAPARQNRSDVFGPGYPVGVDEPCMIERLEWWIDTARAACVTGTSSGRRTVCGFMYDSSDSYSEMREPSAQTHSIIKGCSDAVRYRVS